MKHTKLIPAQQISASQVYSHTTCDGCQYETSAPLFGGVAKWGDGNYDIQRVTIRYESGFVYPEGGTTKVIEYHFCPTCFKTHIQDPLTSKGISPTEEEKDY